MGAISYCTTIVLFVTYISTATPTLLCYDCDAGRECEDPIYFNARTVNCHKQYPNIRQTNGQLVCLALDISLLGSRGFSMFKSGIYRGCRVIPDGEEAVFCDNLKTQYGSRLEITSCKFCNTTRCLP